MSWWDSLIDNVVDAGTDILTDATSESAIKSYLGMGLAGLLGNFDDQNIPVVGYQGSIPEYQAVRQRVPIEQDPNRRPGAGGRRYFTDTIFAQKPESTPMTVEQAKAAAAAQAQGLAGLNPTYKPSPTGTKKKEDQKEVGMAGPGPRFMMEGGRYLDGATDGMADKVPGNVGRDEVRLSDGEFVIPADVVSHLGNGNSNAGAAQLHKFMDEIRRERTGNASQGKEVDPSKFLRGMA